MRIQLQTILHPENDVCNVQELYYHQSSGQREYDGYFNLFYIEKWLKYTNYKEYYLELELKGYKQLIVYHDDDVTGSYSLEPETKKKYCFRLPSDQYAAGVFWFSLVEADTVGEKWVSGSVTGELEDEAVRPVKIGIDICTFRREEYVRKTLEKLQKRIFSQEDLQVSSKIEVYIVDNARTLKDHEKIQLLVQQMSEKVHIIGNKNAGGSGGFTRGMMEVLGKKAEKKFTHVLLMDDDAVTEPDTLVRLYGFLSGLKDEWKTMTVGGTLLQLERPERLFCAGEWWKDGYTVSGSCSDLDLRTRKNAASRGLTAAENEFALYSGWWCCCYSLDVVTPDNLPMPFFIHQDDIEYGMRNHEHGITFLNGVCVWHRDVEMSMPGSNIYYDVRNTLVHMALRKTGKKAALKCVIRRFVGSIRRLRYKDVQLVCLGMEHFFEGSQFFYRNDPEQLHKKIMGMAEKSMTWEKLSEKLTEAERKSVEAQIQALKAASGAGQAGPAGQAETGQIRLNGVKVVQVRDHAASNFRHHKVVLYDPANEKFMLFQRERLLALKQSVEFGKLVMKLFLQYGKYAEEFRNGMNGFRKVSEWEGYLQERKNGNERNKG